jgi:hypothetical protein
MTASYVFSFEYTKDVVRGLFNLSEGGRRWLEKLKALVKYDILTVRLRNEDEETGVAR